MIRMVIDDAVIAFDRNGWVVKHPSNGAILAYCDTQAEANRVRDGLNDLDRQLRAVGEQVSPKFEREAQSPACAVADAWLQLKRRHAGTPRARAGGQEPVLLTSMDMCRPRELVEALDALERSTAGTDGRKVP